VEKIEPSPFRFNRMGLLRITRNDMAINV